MGKENFIYDDEILIISDLRRFQELNYIRKYFNINQYRILIVERKGILETDQLTVDFLTALKLCENVSIIQNNSTLEDLENQIKQILEYGN